MGTGNTYSDKVILTRLRKHMVDNMLSKYSMSKPTWQAIVKRMKDNPEFTAKVQTIEAEHLKAWEELGLTALKNNDENFNVPLFKMYATSKKSFQNYDTLELEARIERLEDGK